LFSLLAGGLVLFHARYGIRKTIVAAMLSAAMIMVGVGGRMTDISALESGTGQSRVQMWSAGLQMLRDDPLFGVGYGTYLEHAAEAAHNSFVHCFAELGLLGGTFFLGAFGSAIWMLMCMAYVDDALNTEGATLDTRLVHMRRYLLAIVIAYVVGMFSLSRSYVVPTYMIVGLCTSWLRLAGSRIEIPRFQFDRQLVWHMVIADVMFLTGIYGFVQIFVRWS
jgi:O-antigen ligase